MNKLTVAALALMAVGIAATSASAQTPTSTTSSDVTGGANGTDLILGFQLASSSTDFEVDLGDFSGFTKTSTATFSLTTTDLSNTFGTNWASNTAGAGVQWSVAGSTSTTASPTFDATSTASSAPKTDSQGNLNTPFGAIGSLQSSLAQSTDAIDGATASSVLIGDSGNKASAISGSYTNEEGGQGATPYSFTSLVKLEQTGAGTDELYSFSPGSSTTAATDLGTFKLNSNGTFTYNGINAAAAPEPSAYALGLCAVLLFLVLKRRHSVA